MGTPTAMICETPFDTLRDAMELKKEEELS
jgi:hypothetical protein